MPTGKGMYAHNYHIMNKPTNFMEQSPS